MRWFGLKKAQQKVDKNEQAATKATAQAMQAIETSTKKAKELKAIKADRIMLYMQRAIHE